MFSEGIRNCYFYFPCLIHSHAYNINYQVWRQLLHDGNIKARPGIISLIDDCEAHDIKVAVVSNSNHRMVETVVRSVFGDDRLKKIAIFSSDIDVPKKPSPDLYLHAARTLGSKTENCFVIEDSEMGLKASLSAQMKTLITRSTFTKSENFEGAVLVVDNLDNIQLSVEYIERTFF